MKPGDTYAGDIDINTLRRLWKAAKTVHDNVVLDAPSGLLSRAAIIANDDLGRALQALKEEMSTTKAPV